jgi:hypothetical protein
MNTPRKGRSRFANDSNTRREIATSKTESNISDERALDNRALWMTRALAPPGHAGIPDDSPWEQPVKLLLTGSVATLPMATLANVPVDDLPRVLRQIDSRLTEEAPAPDAARMMTLALTLAGMRLGPNEIVALAKMATARRALSILEPPGFCRHDSVRHLESLSR